MLTWFLKIRVFYLCLRISLNSIRMICSSLLRTAHPFESLPLALLRGLCDTPLNFFSLSEELFRFWGISSYIKLVILFSWRISSKFIRVTQSAVTPVPGSVLTFPFLFLTPGWACGLHLVPSNFCLGGPPFLSSHQQHSCWTKASCSTPSQCEIKMLMTYRKLFPLCYFPEVVPGAELADF